jgi:hypothetical protein
MDQQKFQDQNQFKKIINNKNKNKNLNQELMLIIPLISLLVLL